MTLDPNVRHLAGDRVSVLLPLPLGMAYDYLVAAKMTLADGDFVIVPLGRREITAVVWGAGNGDIAPDKLKEVIMRLDIAPLPRQSMDFVQWVSSYTLHSCGAVLKMAMSVADALQPPKPLIAYTLPAKQKPTNTIRITAARRRVLEALANASPMLAVELARQANVSPSVIKGLAAVGVLVKIDMLAVPFPVPDHKKPGPKLSARQQTAADDLVNKVHLDGFSVTMLDGVPGSGKTEVYFEAVAKALEKTKQVLVLLPEISLGAQWLSRFQQRFGVEPTLWHSELTPARRRDSWRAVANNSAKVVVGARSALFLPFCDLGLVVVDEEHDASYKQEDGVIYNARDMAVVRSRIGDIPIVLVSATPSLETMVNADNGRYQRLHLPSRYGGADMPEVQVIDMRDQDIPSGRWISPGLHTALEQTINDGGQAMLFLNRRGYAPLTLCRTCGHRMQCPQCSAWLVEHRRGGHLPSRLQCHHCGYSLRLMQNCPSCQAEDSFAACGPGVERLAEEVAGLFPRARTLIAASDTVNGPAAAQDLVRKIEKHEVDLLIGTQIVAKGYHFPLLTLVGVIDADLGLSGGDLRASERTYQLLYQVAGRAGRGQRPGRVLLQTYMPDHPIIKALACGDRQRFLDAEAKSRQDSRMPPFGRLVALIISGHDEKSVYQTARALRNSAPQGDNILVLGPAPAPLYLLRGKFRQRLLFKADKNINVQNLLRRWLAMVKTERKVRVQVDIDPYSFM